MYCILSRPKAVRASGRYNESQTTASGSPTSLVLPLPRQSEVAYRLNFEDLQVILAAGSTVAYLGSLLRVAGSRRWYLDSERRTVGDNPGQYSFLLHVVVQSGLQGVKAKVPFPQFLLNHG